MGSVFAMDHYQATFHTGKTGEKVSVVTSLYTVYVLLKLGYSKLLTSQWLYGRNPHLRRHLRQIRSSQVYVCWRMGHYHRIYCDCHC